MYKKAPQLAKAVRIIAVNIEASYLPPKAREFYCKWHDVKLLDKAKLGTKIATLEKFDPAELWKPQFTAPLEGQDLEAVCSHLYYKLATLNKAISTYKAALAQGDNATMPKEDNEPS